ncbi:hypothetical protein T10_2285 [Trichinella papuae]|uniref:Uncharacterized protein n=1 Tax=Trichinella papuae TaxID=268474 RepID=A0A0V1M1D4_9BILA|nr:hypothetical protein T10_2285 [Trichinella papuae]
MRAVKWQTFAEWEAKYLKMTGESVSVSLLLRQAESMPLETEEGKG